MKNYKERPFGFYEPKLQETKPNDRVREIQENPYLREALNRELDDAKASVPGDDYQKQLDTASVVLRRWYKGDK